MRAAGGFALIALLTVGAGCRTKPCRDKTLLVSLTLQGGATAADSLSVSVSVDGGSPLMQTVPTHGSSGGNLEIDFPSGYPSGHTVDVTIQATSGNTVIGTGEASRTLSKTCEQLDLLVSGSGGNSDGGGEGDMSCTPTVTSCPADACGRVDDGCGGFVTCATPCQVDSAAPTLAGTGDTVVIEGRFFGTTTVDFPGAPGQAATLLGNYRAVVTVPAAATAGDLTINTGNSALGPIHFRRASYALGWNGYIDYRSDEPQGDIGRHTPYLADSRQSHALLSVNDRLIAIGGNHSSTTPLSTVETGVVNVDGTVGSFVMSASTLALPRFDLTAHAIGGIIHVIGGTNGTSAYAMNERATIAADGTIGAFTVTGEPALVTARSAHRSIIIGNTLYVLGGTGGGADLASIESATVNPDGTLGTFAAATPTLAQPRHGFAVFSTRSNVYVVGGSNGATALSSVEAAPINADGTLGTFAAASPTLSMPEPVQAAIVVGSVVYVFGQSTTESAPIASDGTLGAFTVVTGSIGVTTAGVAVARDEVYVTGGYNDGVSGTVMRASLNPSGQLGAFAIDPMHKLAEPRSSGVVVTTPNTVYIVGGTNATGAVGTVEQVLFNPDDSFKSASIVSGVNLVTPRTDLAAAVLPDYSNPPNYFLYVSGGSNATSPALGTVERAPIAADGTLGTFTAVNVALNVTRYGHRMVVGGGYLCVIGGATSSSPGTFTPLTSIECTTNSTTTVLNPWTAVTAADTLKTARNDYGLVVAGGQYWVMGGNGLSSIEQANANSLDSNVATWTASTITTPTQERDYDVLPVGPYTYLLGASTTITRSNLSVASPASFAAYAGSTLQLARQDAVAFVVGNQAYVFGGETGGTPLDSIESAPLQ